MFYINLKNLPRKKIATKSLKKTWSNYFMQQMIKILLI